MSDPRNVLGRAQAIRREMHQAFFKDCMMSAKMVTEQGLEDVYEWCSAIRPFGNPIYASDLILLLQSRVDSNQTGRPGPMSGDVEAVVYFGAGLLVQGRAKEAIPVMTAMLHDPVKNNREWVAFCLFRMGETDPALRREIEKITFPKDAIGDQKVPDWAHLAP